MAKQDESESNTLSGMFFMALFTFFIIIIYCTNQHMSLFFWAADYIHKKHKWLQIITTME
ncbi:hypothetical protein ABT56_01425 [Photobacterium aquae]|uniref:Uncharacterized protein n=1 Tax=Photobacterium aquae TaxID=1195763 RepID=A0A0J1K3A4_9GAMM|nr:hypothetical protein ABT56_01425 [Photobacterium aquae]